MDFGAEGQTTGNFLSLVEHELRTSLNGLIGNVQLISKLVSQHQRQNTPIKPEALKEYLDGFLQVGQQFQQVLDQLFDYSQISKGTLKIHPTVVDFLQLVQTVVQPFSHMAKDDHRQIVLTYHQETSPVVYGDADRLREIIYNLLEHAIKFSKLAKLEVDVTSDASNTAVVFSINDIGINHSPHQTNDSLGLVLVKHLVELQGGRLTTAHHNTGQTGVSFTIPVQTQDSLELAKAKLGQLNLLIVHDENDWLTCFSDELSTAGVPVHQTTITEANQTLKQDYQDAMPDMIIVIAKSLTQQITHFARAMKSNQQYENIRLFLMLPTSKQYIYDREQALISGYDSVINHMPIALFIETLVTAWTSWKQNGEMSMVEMPVDVNHKVLVVEDNLINQKVVRLLLTELGLNVEVVSNGSQAIAAIEKNQYAAVFVDIGLPDISGLEVIRSIRERKDEKAKTIIVVLTADSTYHDQQEFGPKDVDAYLIKPVTIQQLRKILTPYFSSLMAVA